MKNVTERKQNYYTNRYNQWVLAGKIAVETGAIKLSDNDTVYHLNGGLHYSVIGQDFLRDLGIAIK